MHQNHSYYQLSRVYFKGTTDSSLSHSIYRPKGYKFFNQYIFNITLFWCSNAGRFPMQTAQINALWTETDLRARVVDYKPVNPSSSEIIDRPKTALLFTFLFVLCIARHFVCGWDFIYFDKVSPVTTYIGSSCSPGCCWLVVGNVTFCTVCFPHGVWVGSGNWIVPENFPTYICLIHIYVAALLGVLSKFISVSQSFV